MCEEGLFQLHGITQPTQPLHRRGKVFNIIKMLLSAYSMIHTCLFMCCVGGWYDPVLRGDSQPVRPQQADDPSDDQRSGQKRPRGLHPGNVQDGCPAYNYQK